MLRLTLVMVTMLLWCPALCQSDSALKELHKTIPEKIAEKDGDLEMGLVVDVPAIRSLEELVSSSDLIITGRIIGKKTELVGQRALWTHFKVRVTEVLRGGESGQQLSDPITFAILGGKMKFPQGTATLQNSDLPIERMPDIGQEFLLFLHPSEVMPGTYILVGGSQGAYDLSLGKILPTAEANAGKLYIELLGIDVEEAKARVRNIPLKH